MDNVSTKDEVSLEEKVRVLAEVEEQSVRLAENKHVLHFLCSGTKLTGIHWSLHDLITVGLSTLTNRYGIDRTDKDAMSEISP